MPASRPVTQPTSRRRAKKPPALDSDAALDALIIENTPTVVDPGYDGFQLRVAGMPWADIAAKIGSPTAVAARRQVSEYLGKAAAAQSAVQLQEALQISVARYETLLHSWWTKGTEDKDPAAAAILLRTLERLDRIQRLTESDVAVTRETIVVSADPAAYIRQLQEVVAERTSEAEAKTR